MNHVNEQWMDYWEEKFAQRDFIVHDILRPAFWNNEKIFWWYRQNMYFVAHKNVEVDRKALRGGGGKMHYLHPAILETRNAEMEKLQSGEEGLTVYLKMLRRAIMNKFRKRNR